MISNILVVPSALVVGYCLDKFKGWIIVLLNAILVMLSLSFMLLATLVKTNNSNLAHAFIFIGLCGSMTFGITTYLVVSNVLCSSPNIGHNFGQQKCRQGE
jgi:hypothetical protein